MRTVSRIALPLVAFALLSCADERTAEIDESLSADLAIAASEVMQLAPRDSGYAIAAVEVAPPATRVSRSAPSRSQAPREEAAPEPVSVEPAEVVAMVDEPQVEETPVEAEEAPVEAPVEIDRPAPVGRPRPMPPVELPAEGGDDGDDNGPSAGEVIGTVIGVVIRGGAVGDDDCDLHRRPRPGVISVGHPVGIGRAPIPRGGIAINERIPRRTVGFPR